MAVNAEVIQQAKDQVAKEAYVVIVLDIAKQVNYYMIVPSRKELSEMLTILPNSRYALSQVQTIYNYKEYKKFKNDLIFGGDNKVKELFFGEKKSKKKSKKKNK